MTDLAPIPADDDAPDERDTDNAYGDLDYDLVLVPGMPAEPVTIEAWLAMAQPGRMPTPD